MRLDASHEFLAKHGSTRAARVMDHFGIGFEQGRHVIAEGLELPIEAGDVVLFTGASGSGKSSLMREWRRGSPVHRMRRPMGGGSSIQP
jgi:ABC-type ATPase with predicted acetyltransferase domain